MLHGDSKTSCAVLLLYTTLEVYTKYGMASERKTRHALYTPPRLGRSYQMGQAQVCCHESEKTGPMELEGLYVLATIRPLLPHLQECPHFRLLKVRVI